VGPRHELIPLSEPERWQSALAELPHTHAHTWGFCRAVARTSGAPTYLYRYERSGSRLTCVLAERRVDAYVDVTTPYGFGGLAPSGELERFPEDWRQFATSRGWVCGYIALNPVLSDARGFPNEEVHVHNHLFVMDLRGSDHDLLLRLSRNRRRQLRDWRSTAATLEHDRGALTDFLLGTYTAFFERKGAGAATNLSGETMAAIASLDDVFLVGASRDSRIESVALFGYTSVCGDALFNVSVAGGERHAVHLIWAAVEHLRELGVERLNLGGGVREGDDIAEFKRRFGATRLPLRSLRQVYRPDVYERLCANAGVSPGRSGWFPPYRAREAGAEHPVSPAGSDR
jgi:hypothetical protein